MLIAALTNFTGHKNCGDRHTEFLLIAALLIFVFVIFFIFVLFLFFKFLQNLFFCHIPLRERRHDRSPTPFTIREILVLNMKKAISGKPEGSRVPNHPFGPQLSALFRVSARRGVLQ